MSDRVGVLQNFNVSPKLLGWQQFGTHCSVKCSNPLCYSLFCLERQHKVVEAVQRGQVASDRLDS